MLFRGEEKNNNYRTNNQRVTLLLSIEVNVVCAIKSLPGPNTTF